MDKITYSADENEFLRTNFFSMTNQQLLQAVNSMREIPVCLSNMRHQCYRLGLNRGIQIRWSKADIEFLKENYKKHGYKELAMMLNERKSTFRMIDGEKVFRKFKKKHVEKKQMLLGLVHTDEETYAIRLRNNEIFNLGYTTANNAYTQGYRKIFSDNEIRVWNRGAYLYMVIKIDGKFVFYSRYVWEQKNGPIPADKILRCKTEDHLNCDPENWELYSRVDHISKNIGRDELTDEYLLSKLSHLSPDLKPQFRQMPELIELKRNQIKLKRTINELTEITKNDR